MCSRWSSVANAVWGFIGSVACVEEHVTGDRQALRFTAAVTSHALCSVRVVQYVIAAPVTISACCRASPAMMVVGFYPNPNDLFLLEDALAMSFFFYSNIKVTNTLFLYHFQNRKIEITFFILSVYLELKMDINNKRKERKYSDSWKLNNTLLSQHWVKKI